MNTQTLYEQKIARKISQVEWLKQEIAELEKRKEASAGKDYGMGKWVDYQFESSSGLTQEFASFARDFRKYIKSVCGQEYELENWSRGHFEVSGFIKNKATGKYAYFSTSDCRFFPNEWFEKVLIRTAEHAKDYTGGRNGFFRLDQMSEAIDGLTQ